MFAQDADTHELSYLRTKLGYRVTGQTIKLIYSQRLQIKLIYFQRLQIKLIYFQPIKM